jgi:hypothetical protein
MDMLNSKSLLAHASMVFFASALALGCASAEDDVEAAGSAASSPADTPTLEDHVNHPAIEAIREQVNAVDALVLGGKLVETTNPGCDGSNTKFVDGAGRIRKYVTTGGESEFGASMTSYYDAAGKLLFVFRLLESFGNALIAQEHRVWVRDDQVLFQTIKEAPIDPESHTADFSKAEPRLPVGEEEFGLAPGFGVMNPEADFKFTGCPDAER